MLFLFEFRRILGKAKAQANSLIIRTEFSSTRPVILDNYSSFTKKVLTNVRTFCGAYETRTRDLLRDRQAF